MNKRGQRRNVWKQEELVSAIYEFARDNDNNVRDIHSESFDGKTKQDISGAAVHKALTRIMEIFGYVLTEIQ